MKHEGMYSDLFFYFVRSEVKLHLLQVKYNSLHFWAELLELSKCDRHLVAS